MAGTKKKKQTFRQFFTKGTEVTDKKEVLDLVKKSVSISALEQAIYDDGTQSFKIEIHFPVK